jgi:hypothetical protein
MLMAWAEYCSTIRPASPRQYDASLASVGAAVAGFEQQQTRPQPKSDFNQQARSFRHQHQQSSSPAPKQLQQPKASRTYQVSRPRPPPLAHLNIPALIASKQKHL